MRIPKQRSLTAFRFLGNSNERCLSSGYNINLHYTADLLIVNHSTSSYSKSRKGKICLEIDYGELI